MLQIKCSGNDDKESFDEYSCLVANEVTFVNCLFVSVQLIKGLAVINHVVKFLLVSLLTLHALDLIRAPHFVGIQLVRASHFITIWLRVHAIV